VRINIKKLKPVKDKQELKEDSLAMSETKVKSIESVINKNRQEQDKRFLMWTGVIFFMVLIFAFWLFNFKNIFQLNKPQQIKEANNWQEVKDELSKTMAEIKASFSQLNQVINNQSAKLLPNQSLVNQQQLEQLKDNLLEKAQLLATSTATTTP